MWTKASREIDLVSATVADRQARALLFQASINLELLNNTTIQLHAALDELNFHNFARAFGSCHMDEGIFGSDIHHAQMLSHTQQVTGLLLAAVTAGHRFARCVRGARSRDRGRDWATVRHELDRLEHNYREVRNFLEHLDKELAKQAPSLNFDCSFTPDAVLTCKSRGSVLTFDFTKAALKAPSTLFASILGILEARKKSLRVVSSEIE